MTMCAIESWGSVGLRSGSPDPFPDSFQTGSDIKTSGAVRRGLPKIGKATHWKMSRYFILFVDKLN